MADISAPPDRQNLSGTAGRFRPALCRYLLLLIVAGIAIGFLAAPWPFEVKAHALLHGICGQTVAHTMVFQQKLLPLDSRCVGIYGGMIVTVAILVAFGRTRAAALPSPVTGVFLLAFISVMAIDGVNSLLTDLGKWHPYTPTNDLRFATGWLTGVTLGTILMMLTAMTLWKPIRPRPRVLPAWWWPIALALPGLPVLLLLRTGWNWVFYPVTVILIASALMAFGTLALCIIVMLRNRENRYERFEQIAPTAAIAILIALGVLLFLAGGRFWLEASYGLAVSP